MIYVTSDIHGCHDKFKALLKAIQFKDTDTMYILGDIVDRGSNPVDLLFDLMCRTNIFPILGNHEYMCYKCLKQLNVEINEKNVDTQIDVELLEAYNLWLQDGGVTTVEGFRKLSSDDREEILDYLSEFSLYEKVTVNNQKFILVHAGLDNFDPNRSLDSYDIHEMLFTSPDYNKQYFKNAYLVTGHTPTFLIDETYRNKIYKNKNHISIDCGAVYGERLGCIRLDDLEEFYV